MVYPNWAHPTKGRFLMITTKGNLEAGRKWLDDNLPPIFTKYLPKNPKYIPDTEHPVPHRTDQRQPNATLDKYADQLWQKITVQPHQDNKPPSYARPPMQCTRPQATISYSEAAKKTLNPQNTTSEQPKKKKACNLDAISTMTNHSTKTEQTSMTTMTNVNLKQEILSTLHSELTQLIKQDLQLIQADIQTIQNTIQMQAEQQHTKMQTFNSNLSTSHEHFNNKWHKFLISSRNNLELSSSSLTHRFKHYLCTSLPLCPTLNSWGWHALMSPFNLHPVTEQLAPHQHDSTSCYPPWPMRPNTSNPYTHTTQPLPTSCRLFQPHNPSQSHNTSHNVSP